MRVGTVPVTWAADRYYVKTLALFGFGTCITFAGVFLDMSITFITAGP